MRRYLCNYDTDNGLSSSPVYAVSTPATCVIQQTKLQTSIFFEDTLTRATRWKLSRNRRGDKEDGIQARSDR